MKRMFGIELQQLMTSKLLAMRANVSWERGGRGHECWARSQPGRTCGTERGYLYFTEVLFFDILCHCIARIEDKTPQTVFITDLISVICDKVW